MRLFTTIVMIPCIFVVPDESAVCVLFGDGYGDVEWPALFVRLADEMTRK